MTLKAWIKHLEFLRDYYLSNAEDNVLSEKGHVFFIKYVTLKQLLDSKDTYLK